MSTEKTTRTLVQLGFESNGQDQRPLHFLESNGDLIRKFVLLSKTGDRFAPKLYSWARLGEAMYTEFGIYNVAADRPYSTKELSKKWAEVTRKRPTVEQTLAKCATGKNDRLRLEAAIKDGPMTEVINEFRIEVLTAIADLSRQIERLAGPSFGPTGEKFIMTEPPKEKSDDQIWDNEVENLRKKVQNFYFGIIHKHIQIDTTDQGFIEIRSNVENEHLLAELVQFHNSSIKAVNFLLNDIPEISTEIRLRIYFREVTLRIGKKFNQQDQNIIRHPIESYRIKNLAQSASEIVGNSKSQMVGIAKHIFTVFINQIAWPGGGNYI